MNVLVINCGSSSLKYPLIDSETENVLAKGLCERIGIDGRLVYQKAGNDKEDTYAMACILLKSIGAPGRNRTHGPQLRRTLAGCG